MVDHRIGAGRPAWSLMCLASALSALLFTARVHAEGSPTTQPADAAEPAEEAPGAVEPLAGPKYAPLRWNDDFPYLDGPEGSYRPDFFDPIKRIHLSDKLILSLGGEARGRMEAVTHRLFGAEEPAQDTLFQHRYLYHADLQYGKLARFFAQGTNAFVEDVDGAPLPAASDHFDAHQMFADLRFLGEEVPLTLRIGRQELLYGKQRLVSPLGWRNVQRAWDGAKVLWQDATWNVDVWYAKPVVIDDHGVDCFDEEIDFYGFYTTYKGIPRHGVDAYFLALVDRGNYVTSNVDPDSVPLTGDLSVYTMGSRFWGETPLGEHTWDYDTEFAWQFGKADGDSIRAWMWAAETGYTLSNWPWTPRIGVGIDGASGDADPFDGVHGTFNQLFPLGHAYFGYLDLLARQNIWAQNVNFTVKPHKQVTSSLAWHTFWVEEERDAIYNAAGGRTGRRSLAGGVGKEIGHELDFTLIWSIDLHASVLFGYSHFWASDFVAGTGVQSEDPDFFYVQYTYQF